MIATETTVADASSETANGLSSSRLDAEGLERWLDHLESHTQVHEVVPKRILRQDEAVAPQSSLADARRMLLRKTVLAIQLRYHEADAEWREILMVIGSRYRSDRMRVA
jgi:hypothetical protein